MVLSQRQKRDPGEGGDTGRWQGGEFTQRGGRVPREKEWLGAGTLKQPLCEMFPHPRLPQLSAAIALVGGISQQLQERKAEALAQISSAFEDLEQALQQRKQALVSDLEAICGAKQKVRLLTRSHRCPS